MEIKIDVTKLWRDQEGSFFFKLTYEIACAHTGNHMQLTRTTAAKIEIQRHGKRYGNLKNDNIVSFITYIIWIWVTQKLYIPPKNWFVREHVRILLCWLAHKRRKKFKYCCTVENIFLLLYKKNQILHLEKGNQINISILPVPSSLQWMGPQQDLGPKQCLPVFDY